MVAYCISLYKTYSFLEIKVSFLIDFFLNKLLVSQSLVSYSLSEQFVEIKSVLDQKFNITRFKLQNRVA